MNSKLRSSLFCLTMLLLVSACGGGNTTNSNQGSRPFLMGTTPFFASPSIFPDWRFENTGDKDMLSLHIDDFLGVPWDQCDTTGCTPPSAWVTQVTDFVSKAKATGKLIYLAVSPLSGRRTLAPKLDASGNKIDNWAPVDANGCYPFATDNNAGNYKQAYISYMKYLIGLVKPDFLSPAIEMNIQFTNCPAQKSAWIAWYSDVYSAIKADYPSLPVFATFQLESMYGISNTAAACTGGLSLDQCFDSRLAEALAIPGDRIAFSTYPLSWIYWPDYNYSYPTDTYQRVQSATTRRIWIAETGWAAVPVLQSYPHGTGSCGTDLFPASNTNDTEQQAYLGWLLSEAKKRNFEAVVWWLNRDYLDGTTAATCPCTPATSDTCMMADTFYSAGGDSGEIALRVFGNMALRNYDGSARPAHATWLGYYNQPLKPLP